MKPVAKKLRTRRLTAQQQAFVDHVVAGLPAAQAAEQAGYGGTGDGPTYTPAKAASVLLAKAHIAKAIRDGRTKQREERAACRPELNRNEVLSDLDDVTAMAQESGPSAWSAAALLKIAEIKAKILKLFDERAPLAGENPASLQVRVTFVSPNDTKTRPTLPPARGLLGCVLDGDAISAPTDVPSADSARSETVLGAEQTSPAPPSPSMTPPCAADGPEEATLTCPVDGHGAYTAHRKRLYASRPAVFHWSSCPVCAAEGRQDQARLAALLPGTPEWRQ